MVAPDAPKSVMADFVVPDEVIIGGVRIAPATILAPMAGVTDTVFRRLIRSQGGCGLIMTEFTSSHGIVAASRATKPTRTFRYLHFQPDEHPISAQLFGSDPQVMADAAKYCEDLGFDIVDINFGCPVKKVVTCNGGSGLLRDLPLVERELELSAWLPPNEKFCTLLAPSDKSELTLTRPDGSSRYGDP